MQIVCLDAETYFDNSFTLKKLTTEAYVRDPRFEVHGWAIRHPDGTVGWMDRERSRQVLCGNYWSTVGILCHHAQFDGLILSHHYGIRPKFWFDNLAMARLVLGNHVRVGLDSLASHFGLAAKTVPYNAFKGRHWPDLDDGTQRLVADGACHDVALTWTIFERLMQGFPREELEVIDATIRMFTEPRLTADAEILGKVWTDEDHRKNTALRELQVAAGDLQSAEKFAGLLRSEGVEPATKEGKRGAIFAFAKTDEFMRELMEHENPRVAALAQARLGVKSTILQTRAETIGEMAGRGPLCVYLNYCGAHTTRWSGGDKTNFQNFKRGSGLRDAIKAPAGYTLATIDLSQIEARLLAYLAGQEDLLEQFRSGGDPYSQLATAFYGRTITKADASERGTGKQGVLSCGYGCGPDRFRRTAALGIYGPPVTLSLEEAQQFVALYRAQNKSIVGYWRQADTALIRLANGQAFEWGPMAIRDRRIYLPNGAPLIYDTLEWHTDPETSDQFWRYRTRQGWTKLYGAKLVENVVQALARVVVSQAMIRIRRAGISVVNTEHDSLWLLFPEAKAQEGLAFCQAEMTREPAWLPGIPLACEATVK